VGRDAALSEVEESLADGPGAPARLSLFSGVRGVGKTVMLLELARLARERDWVVVADTATDGLVARLTRAVEEAAVAKRSSRRRVASVTLPTVLGVGGGGVTLEAPQPTATQALDFRRAASELLDRIEKQGRGLLITVDEVTMEHPRELRDLATAYQHLVGESRNVAMALAGLPSGVSELLNDRVLTFLRRATPFHLGRLTDQQVAAGLSGTIEGSGRTITSEALKQAVPACGGYPFMVQLVGYHAWRRAVNGVIGIDAVAAAVPVARERLGTSVLGTAVADLSPAERAYLAAMAVDDGPSRTAEVAERLKISQSAGGQRRLRLVAAGIIEPVERGLVRFTLPYLRGYLRAHSELRGGTGG
jgi:hypothetical protein